MSHQPVGTMACHPAVGRYLVARPLFYPWDVSHSGKPLGQMSMAELAAHLVVLRAREGELEQLDTRLLRNARQLERDRDHELARLRLAILNAEHERESKVTRGF